MLVQPPLHQLPLELGNRSAEPTLMGLRMDSRKRVISNITLPEIGECN